jgi:hypothetical protein
MSWQPSVYRTQGGNELVVKSTGVLKWGELETGTTTANLSNNGISIVVGGTTATGANSYTMNAPQPGQIKFISCTTANTSDVARIVGPTTTTLFGVGTGLPRLNINRTGTVCLVGVSTLVWHVCIDSTATPIATLSS